MHAPLCLHRFVCAACFTAFLASIRSHRYPGVASAVAFYLHRFVFTFHSHHLTDTPSLTLLRPLRFTCTASIAPLRVRSFDRTASLVYFFSHHYASIAWLAQFHSSRFVWTVWISSLAPFQWHRLSCFFLLAPFYFRRLTHTVLTGGARSKVPLCFSLKTYLMIELEGWNFKGILLSICRVFPQNFSPLALLESHFLPWNIQKLTFYKSSKIRVLKGSKTTLEV